MKIIKKFKDKINGVLRAQEVLNSQYLILNTCNYAVVLDYGKKCGNISVIVQEYNE